MSFGRSPGLRGWVMLLTSHYTTGCAINNLGINNDDEWDATPRGPQRTLQRKGMVFRITLLQVSTVFTAR